MTVPNPTMVHILNIATAALGTLWNTASVSSALSNLRYISMMVVAIPMSKAYSMGIIFSPALFFRFIAITVTSIGIKDIRGLGRLPLFSSLSSSLDVNTSPAFFAFFIIIESQKLPISSIKILEIKPTTVPAIKSTPKPWVGIMFCTCGAPGAIMANVQEPKYNAAGINRRGMLFSLKIASAMGNVAKIEIMAVTPP